MSIKSFLCFLFVGITFTIVLILGLFNDISIGTIIMRLLVFSLLMGFLGFVLGYLLEFFARDLDINDLNGIGKSFDSFVAEQEEADLYAMNNMNKEINPFMKPEAKKLNVDPRVAAKAIQKVMHEDET